MILSVPILNEITNASIDLLIKKYPLKYALRQNLKTKNELLNKSWQTYNWIIRISSPSGPGSEFWGDTYFAEEIKVSLEKLGQKVEILHRDQLVSQTIPKDTVVLTIRGLLPFTPVENALNLIWVISHPSQISKYELSKFDVAFAASTTWASSKSKQWNLKIHPLLQATNSELFKPESTLQRTKSGPVFIGNSRGVFRQSVKVASKIIQDFQVVGVGWEKYLQPTQIKKNHIFNHELPKIYREAELVLNDHWPDMAKLGFISNRVFDVVACNGKLISDYLPEIKQVFGNSVIMYQTKAELTEILKNINKIDFGSESERLAQANKVIKLHSFDQRAIELLHKIKNLA